MKRIVILGAGFAGVRCALELEKKIQKRAEIVLVNKRPAHIFRPDLYEVATAYHPEITETCMRELSDTVAIPLNKIFDGKKIKIILDRVMGIDLENNAVMLEENKKLSFNYLVVALGSAVNDFGIPGLKEHAQTLKTITDAMALCCNIDGIFYERWKQHSTEPISLVVGGGGATGVEFACELDGYIEKLTKKYHFPPELVSIRIVEGGLSLASQSEKGTQVILQQLAKKKISVDLNTKITKVTAHSISVHTEKSSHSIHYTLFIWSGGVMPYPLVTQSFKKVSPRGGVMVNQFLQSEENTHVFACGDNAAVNDPKTQHPVPWLAQAAIGQGELVAENIINLLEKKPMKEYNPKLKGVVIPLGKRFAILEHNGAIISGSLVWFLRKLIDLSYSMSILPWWYAFKKWFAANRIFAQND